MKAQLKIIILGVLFIVSCKTPSKIQQSPPKDYSKYYYRISHLPMDSMVLTANNKLVPKYLKDLDFLDGYEVPTFQSENLSGLVRKVDYKGKLTLLNFWFIGCPPCVEEIPYLNKLQEDYQDELEIVSLCRDSREEIQDFVIRHPIYYTIIPNSKSIIDDTFKFAWGYPKNILVDTSGRVLTMTRGFLGIDDDYYKRIEQLISKQKPKK